MFFKERIRTKPQDRIIDIGPGAFPHPVAHACLELEFADEHTARAHRSGYDLPPQSKDWIFYPGGRMPFGDRTFDYSICSHVMQMAEDVDTLVKELWRVSTRGYVEFPHPLYDFLFDFPTHRHFITWNDDEILWLPKTGVDFRQFSPVTSKMRAIFEKGHCDFVPELSDELFFGFEWNQTIRSRRVSKFEELFSDIPASDIQPFNSRRRISGLLRTEARAALRWMGI